MSRTSNYYYRARSREQLIRHVVEEAVKEIPMPNRPPMTPAEAIELYETTLHYLGERKVAVDDAIEGLQRLLKNERHNLRQRAAADDAERATAAGGHP